LPGRIGNKCPYTELENSIPFAAEILLEVNYGQGRLDRFRLKGDTDFLQPLLAVAVLGNLKYS